MTRPISVLALAMAASMSFGGIARAADAVPDATTDMQKAAPAQGGRNLRYLPRRERPQRLADVSEPGGTAGTVHRAAAQGVQGSISRGPRCTSLHVGYGIPAERFDDQNAGRLLCGAARRARQGGQFSADRPGQTSIRGRCASAANSALCLVSRCSCRGPRNVSASGGATCTLSAQAAARDSKRASHRTRDAWCDQGSVERSDAGGRRLSRINLRTGRSMSPNKIVGQNPLHDGSVVGGNAFGPCRGAIFDVFFRLGPRVAFHCLTHPLSLCIA